MQKTHDNPSKNMEENFMLWVSESVSDRHTLIKEKQSFQNRITFEELILKKYKIKHELLI